MENPVGAWRQAYDRPMDDGSENGRKRRLARHIARDLGDAALVVPEVRDAVIGVTLIPLLIVFVPLGLLFLVVSALLFYGVFVGLLGSAAGGLTSTIAAAWWVGTLMLMFVLFRGVYRRLARRWKVVGTVATRALDPDLKMPHSSEDAFGGPEDVPGPSATPTLAELDARLAPGAPRRDPGKPRP